MKPVLLRLILWSNIVWALIIFILCAIPGEDIPNPGLNIPHLDKVVHFGMFFIMSVLLAYVLEAKTRLPLRTIYLLAIATALVYGGAIELLQHYFFNRGGDVWDWLANILGGIAGCLCFPLSRRIFPSLR